MTRGNVEDARYQEMLGKVARRIADTVRERPLFHVGAHGLWKTYLNSFGHLTRRHHDCHACRDFIERYGDLVTISDNGIVTSVVWDRERYAYGEYLKAFGNLRDVVTSRRVESYFVTSRRHIGRPVTGAWCHLHGTIPVCKQLVGSELEANKVRADIAHRVQCLMPAVAAFEPVYINKAIAILDSGAYRGEVIRDRLQWFANISWKWRELQELSRDAPSNFLWLQASQAPAGWCQIRGSVVGSLLDDIKAGRGLTSAKKSLEQKMRPDQYLRPTAAPSAGAVERAEKLFAEMGLASALQRRQATREDIAHLVMWRDRSADFKPSGGRLFQHLLEAPPAATTLEAGPITWAKFVRDVLPKMTSIHLLPPTLGPYGGFTTAVDSSSGPILKWDSEPGRTRNQVSFYLYINGSAPHQWGLINGVPVRIDQITHLPEHDGAILLLEGAADTHTPSPGLFPETLRKELHEVRHVIEEYNRREKLVRLQPPLKPACGIVLKPGFKGSLHVRVKTESASGIAYTIDRWD